MLELNTSEQQAKVAKTEAFLKDCGFNNREIAVYLALCKTKTGIPSDIGKIAGIGRSDAYLILDSLVDKGFAIKKLEKPVRYILAPPKKAFTRDLASKHSILSSLEAQIADSTELFTSYNKNNEEPDSSKFELIKSTKFIFDRKEEMFRPERCKQEILYLGTEQAAQLMIYYLKDQLLQLLKRGINIKLLLPITSQNKDDVLALSKVAEIKHIDQNKSKSRVLIVDKKECMLVYHDSTVNNNIDLGLWLNNTQFSELQADLFNSQWVQATDLHTRVKDLELSAKDLSGMSSSEDTTAHSQILFTVNSKCKITYLSSQPNQKITDTINCLFRGIIEGFTKKSPCHPEDQPQLAKLWQTGQLGASGQEEFRTIDQNGAIIWWNISWLPLTDKKGQTELLRVSLNDITSKKKIENLEKALIKNEQFLARSQKAAHIGSWEIKMLTGELTISDEVNKILNLPKGIKIEKYSDLLKIIPETDLPFFEAPNQIINVQPNEEIFNLERTFFLNNERKVVQLNGEFITNEKGQAIQAIGTIFDITDLKNAQEKLVESENRYRLQFAESSDAIMLADAETGTIVDCNSAATKLTGYSKGELIGKNQQFVHPPGPSKFTGHLTNPDTPILQKVLKKSGELIDVSIKASVFDLNGRKMILGTFRDITDAKKAEEEVKQARSNFQTFFDTINDFLFVLDMNGTMLKVNKTVRERLGYTENELIGKTVLMIHPPELQLDALRTVQDMVAGKKISCPIPLITKDGRYLPVETRVFIGKWDDKQVLFGISKDLSQLKLSEAKFSQAFHNSAVLMAITTQTAGDFLEVNQAFLDTLGYTREEVIGKASTSLNIFADLKERDRALVILNETGKVRNFDVKIRTKNGSILLGLFSVDYITIGESNSTYLLTTMVDITERLNGKN